MAARRPGQKDTAKQSLVRTMPAGVVRDDVRDRLLAERPHFIALMNRIAADTHVANPLDVPAGYDQAAIKRHIGSQSGDNLKYAYAQRLAEAAQDAVANTRKAFVTRLSGTLRHLAAPPTEADKAEKDLVWSRVAPAIRASVTAADVLVLRGLPERTNWLRFMADTTEFGLTERQAVVLEAVQAFALSRYACPVFNHLGPQATDTFIVRLNLDERIFRGYSNDGKRLFAEMNAGLQVAFTTGKKTFTWPLRLTDPRGPGEFSLLVRFPAKLWNRTRRGRAAEVSSVCLEIGPDRVEVRVGMRQPRTTPDVAKRTKFSPATWEQLAVAVNARMHLQARDIGMVNTMAHSMVRRDVTITADLLRSAAYLNKEQSHAYRSEHTHDGSAVLRSWHHSGRGFLDAVAGQARRVDALRLRIDKGYAKLAVLKQSVLAPLGLTESTSTIPENATHTDPLVRHFVGQFFRLLAHIRKLKDARVEAYRRVDVLKRNWFGWVTNREVECALAHDAVVVREATTYVTIQTDHPDYKGRTFNRMMDNASRGRVERMASGKLAWAGIPEVVVPSFYTSSTDTRFGVVEGKQRKNERFTAHRDGAKFHADEHGAETIGLWLLLRRMGLVPSVDCVMSAYQPAH